MSGAAGNPGGSAPARAGPRWDGVVAVLLGLVVNELTVEWLLVPDGSLSSTTLRLGLVVLQLTLVAAGLYALLRKPAWRIPWGRLGLAIGGTGAAWFACFAALDLLAPGLVDLPGVKYFELRQRYRPDSILVMVPRRTGHTTTYRLRGDLTADDDLPPLDLPYRASYNERGFRANGGSPPWDAVVIGDSFVAFGEADSLTVSEMLRRASGLSTYNLGRGWYGPHQYVELLRRHGPELAPRFALLCFFEGNDPEDVAAYRSWRSGGSYRDFGLIEGGLFERFVRLNNALLGRLGYALSGPGESSDGKGAAGPGDGGPATLDVRPAGEPSKMRFAYWLDPSLEPDSLLREDGWRATRELMAEFRAVAERHGIVPVIVFVPAKLTVYRPFLASDGGTSSTPDSTASPRGEALRRIARELEMAHLDLTPLFRRLAGEGGLLYYRQDTHWTVRGRRAAADTLAAFLRERWPEAFEPGSAPREARR